MGERAWARRERLLVFNCTGHVLGTQLARSRNTWNSDSHLLPVFSLHYLSQPREIAPRPQRLLLCNAHMCPVVGVSVDFIFYSSFRF